MPAPDDSMRTIRAVALPADALLNRYARDGGYADCYCMDLPCEVVFEAYVEAFYTTALFRVERCILSLFVRKPSSDADALQLALGRTTRFAAWTVEARSTDQLLLCDFLGRTRSWLMVQPAGNAGAAGTRLYFGSAVTPESKTGAGTPSLGFTFRALMGFHHLYTRALMRAARAKLLATRAS